MGFFANLLGISEEGIRKTCTKIYNKAKIKRPGKPERDYLKLVLWTKPPFDYSSEKVIDMYLDSASDLEGLISHIIYGSSPESSSWQSRSETISDPSYKRNIEIQKNNFFEAFWG
ncbi:hypothetical protein ACFL6K_05420 [Candidatus Latescibacterota bacterium]